MMFLPLQQTLRSLQFKVQVVPRARRDQIVGLTEDGLSRRLKRRRLIMNTNRALITTLARHFGVPSQQLTLIQGFRGLEKTVAVVGVTAQELRSRLQLVA